MKASAAALLTLVFALSTGASHDASPASGMRRHHARMETAEQAHLEKRGRYSGDATFYHVETGNAGACGQMLSASDYVVALNQPQYGSLNAKSSWCGKTITISDGNKQTQARVMDACPTGGGNCGYGSLDMSISLFQFFKSTDVGKFPITWWSGGGGGDDSGNVVSNVVSAVTGNKNNDDNDYEEEQAKKKAAAAQAKADAAEEEARKKAEEAAASASAKASKKAAKISASKSSVSASKASASASASRSKAKHFSMTKAAAASSSSEAAAASRSEARASRSEARAAASAATAQPTGNLNKFEALVKGLNKMVEDANA